MVATYSLSDGSVLLCFQAEDGTRDTSVTGVQTCALPICLSPQSRGRRPETRILLRLLHRRLPHRDRKSVGEGKRVDLGGRRIIKKKKMTSGQKGRGRSRASMVVVTDILQEDKSYATLDGVITSLSVPIGVFFFKQKTAYDIHR